jgi:hypothetical protein
MEAEKGFPFLSEEVFFRIRPLTIPSHLLLSYHEEEGMGMNQNSKESEKERPKSIWGEVKRQWQIGLSILATPLIIIPLIACVLSLYFATYKFTEPQFSLVLNIIAVLLAGVASGGIWDAFKNITGNTLLIKKGGSAVRNLSLARLKVKNISERTKMKASSEEIMNLLGLLEKDVANSLQEWNDILPGVANIEVVYGLLAEKENELDNAIQEKEELNKRLVEEKKFQDGEKEKLEKHYDEMRARASKLAQEIAQLRTKAETMVSSSVGSGGTGVTQFGIPTGPPRFIRTLQAFETCVKCGKLVDAVNEKRLCGDCSK